ncbi:TPA: hypothetical protein N0F65_005706 [Lagenidium giganteum]|uniref:Uncharacterized protein n=1 Tax=Lagenidium giganteum TaxID=4803 RepID=A0AAV2ZBY1_9STRA|nr:TPA: hypothetical protein N0F65_005706 [Lagenidium giganteum]
MYREMKQFVRDMTEQAMKPARIRIQLINIFRISASELPTLRQIQSVSTHHKKKRMASEDKLSTVSAIVNELAFRPSSDDTDPFVFRFKNAQLGRPHVERGSDEDPFLLGVTSKRLLRHLDAPMDTFVFHVDATSKLSSLGYPVLQTEDLYREALYALRTTFAVGGHTKVAKAMRVSYRDGCATASDADVVLTMDYAQNVALPHVVETPAQWVFMSLWSVSIFGIYDAGLRQQSNYVYTERKAEDDAKFYDYKDALNELYKNLPAIQKYQMFSSSRDNLGVVICRLAKSTLNAEKVCDLYNKMLSYVPIEYLGDSLYAAPSAEQQAQASTTKKSRRKSNSKGAP